MTRFLRKHEQTGTLVTKIAVAQAGEEIDYDLLPDATTAQKGALTAADKLKLDGIEAGADVTDFDNVASAGAIMEDYFEDEVGDLQRNSLGSYEVVQANLTATTAPTVNDDEDAGYSIGSKWCDTSAARFYFCADATATLAVWVEVGASGGGGGSLFNGDHGDIIVSASGDVLEIDTDAVTYAKIQNVTATDKVLGRSSSGAGDIEEIACTAAGRAILDDADAAAQRTTLGLGTLATLSSVGSAQITDGSVANADLANVSTQTIKGRTTSGTGAPEDLTAAQATAILSVFTPDTGTGGVKGLVPAPLAGDASKFLKGDGTFDSIPGGGDALTSSPLSQFAATTSLQLAGVISDETGSGPLVFGTSPSLTTPTIGVATATSVNKVTITAPATSAVLTIANGATLSAPSSATVSGTNTGDQTITLTSDVTGSGTGSFAATIAADAVTNAKLADMATGRIKGRGTAGTGDPEDLSVLQVTTLLGTELTANKDIASGYAGLDARIQVPTARQRNRLYDFHVCTLQALRSSPGYVFEGFETPLTTAGALTTVADANGLWTRHTTAGSSSGETAGIAGPHFQYVQGQQVPEWLVRFRTGSSIASITLWVGMWSGAITSLTSPAGKSIAAARFVQGTDTNFATYTCDGTASTSVILNNSASAVAVSTIYEARIAVISGRVEVWINGTKCTTDNTTFLPAAATWMAPGLMLTTNSAVVRTLDISRGVLQHT